MRILNIGSGPVVHGNFPGMLIICADRRSHPGALYEDMEDLTYENDVFDVVVCVNALDHTKNVAKALKELIRVGKYIYIDCALIQKTTSGRGHYWDMLEDGTITNGTRTLDLKKWGFKIEFVDNKMERRYSHVIATMQK